MGLMRLSDLRYFEINIYDRMNASFSLSCLFFFYHFFSFLVSNCYVCLSTHMCGGQYVCLAYQPICDL